MSAISSIVYAVFLTGLLGNGQAQGQKQHTLALVAPAQAPNAFSPKASIAMAPAPMAQQGLFPASANQVNNNVAGASTCNSNQSSLLFIQQAPKAEFLTINNRTILTMSSVSPTMFFTDKPERHAGAMSTEYFTTDKIFFSNASKQWLDSPNAALYGVVGDGKRPLGDTVVIVTLNNPVFDNSTSEVKYDVTFVPNMRHISATAAFYKRHSNATGSPKVITVVERSMRIRNAALFIDNYQTTNLLNPNPVDNTYIPGAGGYSWGYPGVFGGWW